MIEFLRLNLKIATTSKILGTSLGLRIHSDTCSIFMVSFTAPPTKPRPLSGGPGERATSSPEPEQEQPTTSPIKIPKRQSKTATNRCK